MKEQLSNNDFEREIYLALISYIRECLCKKEQVFNDLCLKLNMFPIILKFTKAKAYEDLMVELTWILTNITSSSDSDVIISLMDPSLNGGYDVPNFLIEMVKIDNSKLKEHSLWTFANLIAEENQEFMKKVSESIVISEISKIIEQDHAPVNLIRQATFLLSNLMKLNHKSRDFMIESTEILSTILFCTDESCVIDWCYAFMNFAMANGNFTPI